MGIEQEKYLLTIKSMVYAQLFVDTIDKMQGSSHFKRKLGQKGKSYCREVERFLNTAYGGGDTEKNLLELLEYCEKKIEDIIEKEVVFD